LDGKNLPAVTNVGVKPTISDNETVGAETYILDFEGDLYGKNVQVDLLEFIRPEMHFAGFDELRAQMKRDAERAYELATAGS
jgi:riboflavin kinase / FMN adenylyltransferase